MIRPAPKHGSKPTSAKTAQMWGTQILADLQPMRFYRLGRLGLRGWALARRLGAHDFFHGDAVIIAGSHRERGLRWLAGILLALFVRDRGRGRVTFSLLSCCRQFTRLLVGGGLHAFGDGFRNLGGKEPDGAQSIVV